MYNAPCPNCDPFDTLAECDECGGFGNLPITDKAEVFDLYREALQRIVKEHGKVCPEFEICQHPSCNSSAGAWLVADLALKGYSTSES